MGDGLTTHDSAAHGCRAGFRKSEDMRRFMGHQQTLSRGQIGDRQARDDRGGAGFCRQIRVPLVMIVSWVHRTGAQDQRGCRHESQANGHHDGSLFRGFVAIRTYAHGHELAGRRMRSLPVFQLLDPCLAVALGAGLFGPRSPAYKAKVALAALKGDKTLAELSQQFDVHVNQITQRKTQLLERASEVFATASERPS